MNIQYKGYSAQIRSSDRVGVMCGEVTGIRDVIAFHASSVGEVQELFRESIDDYLDLCEELGRRPNQPMLA